MPSRLDPGDEAPRRTYDSKKKRRPIDLKDHVTADMIAQIFSAHVIKGPRDKPTWNMPSPEALDTLANILDSFRAYYHAAQEARRLNGLLKKASKAFENLDKLVPEVRRIRVFLNGEPANRGVFEAFDDANAKATNKILSFLGDEQTRAYFLGPESLADQARDWQWLINVLPADFETTMQSTNPGFVSGTNRDGPFARYVVALAPLISGEKPNPQSVVRRLIENRSKDEI